MAEVTDQIVDPQLAAFWASDPSVLSETPPEVEAERASHARTVEEAGIALAVAYLVMTHHVSKDLMQQPVPDIQNVNATAKQSWTKHGPLWMKMAVPAIQEVYRLGALTNASIDELEALAADYAESLGEYLNETSADALAQGFNDQLNTKWSEMLAWKRAGFAYGMDKQQMKSYVKGVIDPTEGSPNFELIPHAAQTMVDGALMVRADRIGQNEAWYSLQSGKAVLWLTQKMSGFLPEDTQKQWLTAVDEKVCVICGPLNKKRVPVDEQFEALDGNKYWAPGVHPNCRCDIKLIYPEVSNDTWSMVEKSRPGDPDNHELRSSNGRWRASPKNRPPTTYAEPEEVDPKVEEILRQVREIADEQDKPSPYSVVSPYTTTTQTPSPYTVATSTASPYSVAASPYSTTPSPYSTTASPYSTTGQAAQGAVSPYQKVSRRRQILIMVNGRFKQVNANDVPDDETRYPLYTPVHVYDDIVKGYGQADSDMDIYSPGEIINFDFDGDKQHMGVIGVPYTGIPQDIMESMELRYDDRFDFLAPQVQEETNKYHQHWDDFLSIAQSDIHNIAQHLTSDDLRHIYTEAGKTSELNGKGAQELKDNLVMSQPGSALMHSYIQHIEDKHPDWIGGPDGPGAHMAEINDRLRAQRLHPHTPQVFVFTDGWEGALDHNGGESVMLGGKYQVDRVVFQSANLHMGENRPHVLKGVRMVYLTPIEDDEEGPSDEELRAMSEWDNRHAIDPDNPPPGFMRWRSGVEDEWGDE